MIINALVPEGSARRLGMFRAAVGLYTAIYLLVRAPAFLRLTTNDPQRFDPVGIGRALTGPPPGWLIYTLFAVTVVLAVAVTFGISHRITGPLFGLAVLALFTWRSSWGQILWFENLVALHALIVGFSASAADAFTWPRRRTEPRPASHQRYGHPLRLAAFVSVTTYAVSGVAKLRIGGLGWATGDTLANHIGYSAQRLEVFGQRSPLASGLFGDRTALLTVTAVVILVLELGAPLMLLTGRRLRALWAAAIVATHLGIALTMSVVFAYHLLGLAVLPVLLTHRSDRTELPIVQRRAAAGAPN